MTQKSDEQQSPVSRKLLVRPGRTVAVVNAPPGYERCLEPLPEGARTDLNRDILWALMGAVGLAGAPW
ncbi:MAG: hypothetical protein NVSMB17_00250 [Candidatus Dormibacteria bacterium]